MKKPLSQAARKRISQARKIWWAAKKKREGLQLVPSGKPHQVKSKSVFSRVIDILETEIDSAEAERDNAAQRISSLHQVRDILEGLDVDSADNVAA